MGYFWWGLSVFVHTHAFLLLLLVLPYPKSTHWSWILNSWLVNFVAGLINFWAVYFAILCPCVLLHIAAICDYTKYSSADFHVYGDRDTRKDAHIQLLQSQRNYFISGAAMILCIVVPQVMSIRAESHKMSINSEDILKEAVKEVIKAIKEVEESEDENRRTEVHENTRGVWTGNRPVEFIPREFGRANRERSSIEGSNLNADESEILRDFYERIINQRALNRTNNNQFRQRLARSRFSSSNPQGSINARTPRRFHYGVFD